MAGHKYGKLFQAILRDTDFQLLAPDVQNLYKSLLALPVSAAGVVDLNIGMWATFSVITTVDDVRKQVAELEAARFVVVDHQTFEVLIRTYIKHDVVEFGSSWKTQKGSIDACLQARSPKICLTLASELDRLLEKMSPAVVEHAKNTVQTLRADALCIGHGDPTDTVSHSTQLNYNSTVATQPRESDRG